MLLLRSRYYGSGEAPSQESPVVSDQFHKSLS